MRYMISLTLLLLLSACSTASVIVRSEPAGADVYVVDSKTGQNALLGKTPLQFDKAAQASAVGADVITLKIEKDGFQPKMASVAALGGQNAYVDFKLSRSTVASAEIRESFERNRVLFKKANQLVLLKRYAEGLAELEKILEVDPKNAEAHAAKGSVLYLMKDYDGAGLAWNRALEINPNLESVRSSLIELYSQQAVPSGRSPALQGENP